MAGGLLPPSTPGSARSRGNPAALQYILQNISIALYAKMNGIPWTVDHDLTIADELVIGIGTAELSDSRLEERQRYVGITTVFRGDGNYLLGQLSREASYARTIPRCYGTPRARDHRRDQEAQRLAAGRHGADCVPRAAAAA